MTLRLLACFLLQCGFVSLGVLLVQMLLSSPLWRPVVWAYYNLLVYIGQDWDRESRIVRALEEYGHTFQSGRICGSIVCVSCVVYLYWNPVLEA